MKQLTAKLLIIASLLFANNLFAQPDTSTTQKLLQYIFQNVDKSQVPTGFFILSKLYFCAAALSRLIAI
jgi:hypothetical protein